jgi:signal transduction histidine kinase
MVAVVGELEELREHDVRGASRRLAPPIVSSGLAAALEDLADSYGEACAITITIDASAACWLQSCPRRDPRLKALYRITEQALLNALAHARARHVEVRLSASADRIRLSVEDDGAGPQDPITPGSGSAVIDAWVAACAGEWELRRAPAGGALLLAQLDADLAPASTP